jgi:hypothetical protein
MVCVCVICSSDVGVYVAVLIPGAYVTLVRDSHTPPVPLIPHDTPHKFESSAQDSLNRLTRSQIAYSICLGAPLIDWILFLPTCLLYCSVSQDDRLYRLSSLSQLRVVTAGVWHNLLLTLSVALGTSDIGWGNR